MTTTEAKEKLALYLRTSAALGHASGLVYYDGDTVAPPKSAAVRANTLSELSRISYELTCAPETIEMLETLRADPTGLSNVEKRTVSELWREYDRTRRIPKEEFVAMTRLCSEAETVWHDAKEKNDYASFEPYLGKIFDMTRRIAGYTDPDMHPYDAALNQYERGLTRADCDTFFQSLREKIVPLMHRIAEVEQIDDSPLHGHFPIEKQRAFSDYLMDVMCMDRAASVIGETEHPFTINFSKNDVRITTHYYEDNLASSLYSVVHEGGHGLYELGTGDELQFTGLDSGVSMAIHESQSRFYENIIGRSRSFCSLILPYLKKSFPESLSDVSEEAFYRMINRAEPSLIRTEADELTYSLHIMVRYELERAMLDGELTAHDLPDAWNKLYRRYLGVEVPDDRRGILQDSHWSGGNIGYFPSYALGSAYGAQILSVMQKDFDVYGSIAKHGNLSEINEWNRTHIWTHGCMYDPTDLFRRVAGEFSPDFYTDYLTKKYEEIYNL